MPHPTASIVDSYLEGNTTKEEVVSQILSFARGDIAATGADERKVEKLTELWDAVQPQTTLPCFTILVCTRVLGC
jgi:hypothetical protein